MPRAPKFFPVSPEQQRGDDPAREHDAWFRAEVEKALAEADRPDAEWISHADVVKEWLRKRAELEQRARSDGND